VKQLGLFLLEGMMAHHRCTRCKQESEIRHKYQGGVYCDSCISWIRGFRPHTGAGWLGPIRSIWSSIWDVITDFASSVFQHKTIKRVSIAKDKEEYSRMKAMGIMRARSILPNPQGAAPQKQ
jgi:hypothetical protein